MRAGVARLHLGKRAAADENCLVEFEGCDGLGLIGYVMDEENELQEGVLDYASDETEDEDASSLSKSDTPRSNWMHSRITA